MGLFDGLKASKAYKLQSQGDYEGARKLYEESIQSGMNSPRFLVAYSILLLRSRDFERAREILRKAEKAPGVTPDQKTQIFVNYAVCTFCMGEIDKGIRLLEKQHMHQPSGLTYQTLGCLYVEKYARGNEPDFDQQDREAMAAYEKALSEWKAAQAPAGEALPEGTASPAPEAPARPEDARTAWQKGIEKVQKFIEASLEYDEEDSICLDNMGQFQYRVMGDREKAVPYFKKALQLKPEQIDTLYFLAQFDIQDGKTAEAREKLETAARGRFSPMNFADREKVEAALASLKS